MFVCRSGTQKHRLADGGGGGWGARNSIANGCPRTRKGNSIFLCISSINDILGDNRHSIFPSSSQQRAMKEWERDLREFAATKKQLCDLAERMDCPLSTR